MADSISIQRPYGKIEMAEWREAVAQHKFLRLNSEDIIATNPRTGDQVKLPGNVGNVQMYFPSDEKWFPVFGWSDGIVSFKSTTDSDVMSVAFVLARSLNANLISPDGNILK